MSVASQALPSS